MLMQLRCVLTGVIAQLSYPDQDKQPQDAASPKMHMDVDWDLGVSGHSDDFDEEEEVHGCLMGMHALK